eukprot:364681-Chlamydomonas_euryale.AAC.8
MPWRHAHRPRHTTVADAHAAPRAVHARGRGEVLLQGVHAGRRKGAARACVSRGSAHAAPRGGGRRRVSSGGCTCTAAVWGYGKRGKPGWQACVWRKAAPVDASGNGFGCLARVEAPQNQCDSVTQLEGQDSCSVLDNLQPHIPSEHGPAFSSCVRTTVRVSVHTKKLPHIVPQDGPASHSYTHDGSKMKATILGGASAAGAEGFLLSDPVPAAHA